MGMSLKEEVLAILHEGTDLTLATLRPDGGPQATTVSYASDGLRLYFGCAASSQKAANLARDPRVALTINLPYADWGEIRGLSMTGTARRLIDGDETDHVVSLFFDKFSETAQYVSLGETPLAFFEIVPTVISVLDYRKGFGRTDLLQVGEHERLIALRA
ncbi:pyridoxamine 5'-phosphate oxidase [Caulobacter sp. CCUG 60055]|uniref:pyridoxamine 5'-phosphate oxidase family protein n=1 Tax=Caulobacter sp. CCUG 60055 TaxID=2100090 RepID=UPI001FA74644|nr:pyridoxamine 5'-phosphate oxidase family protein [Caulobacter sp. CCUG 60055]MCI3179228.1 pyridoxamine 5'-phosphate oxidase [Caulobacter sp. CCUG 60055]